MFPKTSVKFEMDKTNNFLSKNCSGNERIPRNAKKWVSLKSSDRESVDDCQTENRSNGKYRT
jgi:hypothetical protein